MIENDDGGWKAGRVATIAEFASIEKVLDVQMRSAEEVRAIISQVRHRDF
jgi:hypothetical protein